MGHHRANHPTPRKFTEISRGGTRAARRLTGASAGRAGPRPGGRSGGDGKSLSRGDAPRQQTLADTPLAAAHPAAGPGAGHPFRHRPRRAGPASGLSASAGCSPRRTARPPAPGALGLCGRSLTCGPFAFHVSKENLFRARRASAVRAVRLSALHARPPRPPRTERARRAPSPA